MTQTDLTWSDVAHCQLDREIYFQPSYIPSISLNDTRLGSCFQGITVPSASWIWSGGTASCIASDLDYAIYKDLISQRIEHNIQQIYAQHDCVTLAMSGGIDSLLLLGFVIRLGLLDRTRFVCLANTTQIHSDSIYDHPGHRHNLESLLSTFARPVDWITITTEDFAGVFNNHDIDHCKCYVTHQVISQLQTDAIMWGWHGNQVLLHKPYLFDEMVLKSPARLREVQDICNSSQEWYVHTVKRWKAIDLVPLRYRHLLVKPWPALDGYLGTRCYGPIGDDYIFDLLRRLNFDTVPARDIADATMARDIMNQNVGDLLDRFIYQESRHDMDTLERFSIRSDLIYPDRIYIPAGLHHHPEGLQYAHHAVKQAQDQGAYPVNTLMMIKTLQHIDHKNN